MSGKQNLIVVIGLVLIVANFIVGGQRQALHSTVFGPANQGGKGAPPT